MSESLGLRRMGGRLVRLRRDARKDPGGTQPLPVRRALGLTREDFATRFHIPVAVLRAWEHGGVEPDAVAQAYLDVIAADPAAVARALGASPPA